MARPLVGAVPADYVLDIPGGFGKIPVGPSYLDGDRATDWQGRRHDYPLGRKEQFNSD